MNLFTKASLSGIIGAILIDVLTYLFRLLGIKTSTPWEIAAGVFLNRQYIYTISGLVIGLIGTIALSIATALLIGLILERTGYDTAWLKGLISANAFGFVTMGLFMRLLNIWPQIRGEPETLFVALFNLSLLGIIQALLIKSWQNHKVNI